MITREDAAKSLQTFIKHAKAIEDGTLHREAFAKFVERDDACDEILSQSVTNTANQTTVEELRTRAIDALKRNGVEVHFESFEHSTNPAVLAERRNAAKYGEKLGDSLSFSSENRQHVFVNTDYSENLQTLSIVFGVAIEKASEYKRSQGIEGLLGLPPENLVAKLTEGVFAHAIGLHREAAHVEMQHAVPSFHEAMRIPEIQSYVRETITETLNALQEA